MRYTQKPLHSKYKFSLQTGKLHGTLKQIINSSHKKFVLPLKNLSFLNCSEEILITRLRTDYIKLTHNYLFLRDSNMSFCNSESIIIQHLICCPNLGES